MKKITVDRIKTGISGLDTLLCGGIPKKSMVLLSGAPGTGKSIMALHLIVNSYKEERCLYVALTQSKEDLVMQAEKVKLPLGDLVDKEKIHIAVYNPITNNNITGSMLDTIRKENISFVIVDSLTALENSPAFLFDEERIDAMVIRKDHAFKASGNLMVRVTIQDLIQRLKEQKITGIFITEQNEDSPGFSSDGVSEFLCDGIILLTYTSLGSEEARLVEVRKMRFTDHKKGRHSFTIKDSGLKVFPES